MQSSIALRVVINNNLYALLLRATASRSKAALKLCQSNNVNELALNSTRILVLIMYSHTYCWQNQISLICGRGRRAARAKYELALKFIHFYGNSINLYKHFLLVRRLNVQRSRFCDHIYTIAFRRPKNLLSQ